LVEYKRRKNVVEQMINNMQTPKNIDKTKLIADANKDNQNTLYARLIAAGSTTAVQAAIMMWGKRRLTQSIANQAAARGTQASKVSRFMPNLYGLLATAAVMGATWILDDWLADKYVQSLINEWFLETADELGFDTAGIDITDMPSKQANKGIYLLGQDAGQPS